MPALTNRELIRRLKKLDPDALVAWRNHDQSIEEIDGYVGQVHDAEPDFLIARTDELNKLGAADVIVLGP